MREARCMPSLLFPTRWVLRGLPIGLPFQASFRWAIILALLMASWAPASLASSVPGASLNSCTEHKAFSLSPYLRVSSSPHLLTSPSPNPLIPYFGRGVEILNEGILE